MAYSEGGYSTAGTAGTQVSPSGGGRIVDLLESTLTHPTHTDGFVDKGDPVYAGDIVGVSLFSAAAATEYGPVDTEGLWNLTVSADDDAGTNAVAVGDTLYIGSTGLVTKKTSGKRYGVALGAIAAGADVVIAVKVHASADIVPEVDFISQSVAFGDFTDNTDATGYVDLTATLPVGAIPLGWKCVVSTGFTGDTTAVVSIGIAGDLDAFSANTAQSVLAAASVGSLALAAAAASNMNAAETVRVTVTGGADFGAITAGVMVVNVYYIRTV